MFLAVAGLLASLAQPSSIAAGVITGRVVDPAGNPLGKVSVVAAQQRSAAARAGRPEAGVRQSGSGPGALTNERGEFRIDALPAGYYIVRAILIPGERPAERLRAGARRFVTTYYPGTINLQGAQFVAVTDAGVTDLVLPVQTVSSYAITGRVVDETGASTAGVSVRLMAPKGEQLTGPALTSSVKTDSNGAFEIVGVIPGVYALLAVPARVLAATVGDDGAVIATQGSRYSAGGRDRQRVAKEWHTGGPSIEYRDADGSEVPIAVGDADVSDVYVTVHRP